MEGTCNVKHITDITFILNQSEIYRSKLWNMVKCIQRNLKVQIETFVYPH